MCIQSLFILCRSRRAVMDTSWFFSPNSSRWAKRGMYRHGSAADTRLRQGGCAPRPQHPRQGHPHQCFHHRLPGDMQPPDPQVGALTARPLPGRAAAASFGHFVAGG